MIALLLSTTVIQVKILIMVNDLARNKQTFAMSNVINI